MIKRMQIENNMNIGSTVHTLVVHFRLELFFFVVLLFLTCMDATILPQE